MSPNSFSASPLTMLVVGLFAVLRWDSTFPDRRDVQVLAPLPVRARTLFLANWIFRIAPIRGKHEYLSASRQSLFVLL